MRQSELYKSDRRQYWNNVFSRGSWWNPDSPAEREKRENALTLIGPGPFQSAFELGCGEGHLTFELAPRAELVCAADISDVALASTMMRCSNMSNVLTLNYNFLKGGLPGDYDIVIASEVLFYVDGVEDLERGIYNILSGLKSGGCFVSIHARLQVDEGSAVNRNWALPFGAFTIANIIKHAGLYSINMMQNDQYRIDIFKVR